MKAYLTAWLLSVILAIPSLIAAEQPDDFELLQNFPDPFCPTSDGGFTDIRFQLPVQSAVLLQVWNPDTTAVVRTLAHGVMPAGYHSIIWDGADDDGADLAYGAYPYSMTATDPQSGDSLFYDMLTATIDCTVAARPGTWGRIKAEFGEK